MNDILQEFVVKQGFSDVTQINNELFGCDGFHIRFSDIEYDIENKIAPGLIKLYYAESPNKGYRKWLVDNS